MTTAPSKKFVPKPKIVETKILERRDVTDDLRMMWIEKPEGVHV